MWVVSDDAVTPAERLAQELADEVLFPSALEVDRDGMPPRRQLDRLAEAGLFGVIGPTSHGGLGADHATFCSVIERLAGGCLTTAFVWLQHHGAVAAVAHADGVVQDRWLASLCRGEVRAGVAFSHLRRPGAPMPVAERRDDDWVLRGRTPWITGWGLVDVVHVAARTAGGDVVWLLVDATARPGFTVEPLRLVALDASATVAASFDGLAVDAARTTFVESFDAWEARDRAGLRTNGSLALGVAGRCCRLLGDPGLEDELSARRRELDAATPAELPAARAAASAFALQAASTLVVASGGGAMSRDHHAQRLIREAAFALVQGQTGAIREAQLASLRPRRGAAGSDAPVR
jgi:alkylation response protein AidB-like acyl-CoA dehydrogenase